MSKVLIVIDMQNDFIDGALGTKEAQAVVPRIEAKIVASKKDTSVSTDLIFTQDTHGENYLDTQEGQKLPVPHCIKDTKGWNICRQLLPYTLFATILEKPTFGSTDLIAETAEYDRIVLMGVCTDICVISNAILMQAQWPEAQITVDAALCRSFDPVLHDKALDVMQGLQMKVINR